MLKCQQKADPSREIVPLRVQCLKRMTIKELKPDLELEKLLPPVESYPHLLEVAGLLLQAGLPLPLLHK